MSKFPITRAGFERLKNELAHLKKVEVPANIKDIEEARGHGDLSENAEYAAAKERQSFIQGKVQEIENNLANSTIVDLKDLTDEMVVFGSTVTIEDANTGEVTRYKLVGPFESDMSQNHISITSPIGKALLRKEVGDEVRATTPGGIREFEIVDISVE
ncbi:MAG TPA: transcription elongation factor GreA [Syntrophales bacterium]|nr:transcription elongation factor GreA [Syntrophales bacterium]HPQ43754.1 transcription elongation factor GreA [Syntrophales bacterium]